MAEQNNMKQRMGSIYLAKNLVTGKNYIGQTRQKNPLQRIREHKMASSNNYFHNSINEHGIDNFMFCWLHFKDLPINKLSQYERYYIWYYDTKNKENGYNMTDGGEISPMHDPEIRKKHKQVMSDTIFGKNPMHDPEIRAKHKEIMNSPEVLAKKSGDNHFTKQPGYVEKRSGENNVMKRPEVVDQWKKTYYENKMKRKKESGQTFLL